VLVVTLTGRGTEKKMPCLLPDGKLTESAKKLLRAASEAALPEELAQASDNPLFKVRRSLRELTAAGLIEESDGKYKTTPEGAAKLNL
jgi:predicted transcriptional regulator